MENVINELKKDLRFLGKYDVLNKSYLLDVGYTFGIKATKNSILDMQVNKGTFLLYASGGIYDTTQKRIIEEVTMFIEGYKEYSKLCSGL